MFWQIFSQLCEERGIKPAKVAEACGINKSNVSLWKSKGYVPRADALKALADQLGVSTDYLLGNEKSTPADEGQSAELSEDDKRMQRLNSKIALLSDSKRAVLEELLDAMLEK